MGRNRAIGRGNALPWSMPSDLARFKALTMGTPMIMGRRTFESIGRPLPGRESIVVSRGLRSLPAGVFRVGDPEAAFALARQRAIATGAGAISVIGGAALFAAMMPRADCLAMTLVDLAPEADTFFPPIDFAVWHETSRYTPDRRGGDEAACVFIDYERRA